MDAHHNHQHTAFLVGMKLAMGAAILFVAGLPALLH